jgi:hypothetical protein
LSFRSGGRKRRLGFEPGRYLSQRRVRRESQEKRRALYTCGTRQTSASDSESPKQ